MNSLVSLGMSLALGYAGFVRGRHIQRTCPTCKIAMPTLGWSLLGPVGPGYLVGRLTQQERSGRGLKGLPRSRKRDARGLKGLPRDVHGVCSSPGGSAVTLTAKPGGSFCVTRQTGRGPARPVACLGDRATAEQVFATECRI